MFEISKPFVEEDDPARHVRCEDALQYGCIRLVEAAVEAGWSEREVLAALVAHAERRMLTIETNDNTAALMAMLKRMT